MTRPFGSSPGTATEPSSRSMSGTTAPINTRMAANGASSSGPERPLSCGPKMVTPDLFGGSSSTRAASRASTAPSSATKGRSYRRSLSDRLTPLLISSGLVAGITPTSTRKQCGAPIPDIASFELDGTDPATRRVGFWSFDVSAADPTDLHKEAE